MKPINKSLVSYSLIVHKKGCDNKAIVSDNFKTSRDHFKMRKLKMIVRTCFTFYQLLFKKVFFLHNIACIKFHVTILVLSIDFLCYKKSIKVSFQIKTLHFWHFSGLALQEIDRIVRQSIRLWYYQNLTMYRQYLVLSFFNHNKTVM